MWYDGTMSHKSRPSTVLHYALSLGARGRLVLPAPVRERLELREGDRLVLAVEADGSMRLTSLRQQVRRLQGGYRHLSPEASLVDQLIAERRQEGARE